MLEIQKYNVQAPVILIPPYCHHDVTSAATAFTAFSATVAIAAVAMPSLLLCHR
jgi:hypothetical protein